MVVTQLGSKVSPPEDGGGGGGILLWSRVRFLVLDWVETLLYCGGRWEGDAAAMTSSEALENRLSSSGGLGAVAAWIRGWLMALWASRRLSARVARSSSLKSEKFVMAARTGSGRRRNQRARRMSIFLLLPAVSGERWQRGLISVRASDGH